MNARAGVDAASSGQQRVVPRDERERGRPPKIIISAEDRRKFENEYSPRSDDTKSGWSVQRRRAKSDDYTDRGDHST